MGGQNRIVVDYQDYEGLVLLGAFNTKSGVEISRTELEKLEGWELVTLHKTWGKGYDSLKEEISKDKEGYVIRFKNGFRMKIKGEEYVRLHRILTNVSNRDIWEYLKNGKPLNDIIEKVPDEFYDWVKETKESFITQYETLEREYKWIFKVINRMPHTHDRSVFAQYAKKYKHPGILFSMLDGKDYSEQMWRLLYPPYSKPFKKENKNEI